MTIICIIFVSILYQSAGVVKQTTEQQSWLSMGVWVGFRVLQINKERAREDLMRSQDGRCYIDLGIWRRRGSLRNGS